MAFTGNAVDARLQQVTHTRNKKENKKEGTYSNARTSYQRAETCATPESDGASVAISRTML